MQDHGSSWRVRWDARTGAPRSVYGPGIRVSQSDIDSIDAARLHSERFLERQRELLGTGRSVLVERIGHTVGDVHIFVYDQEFAGLQVLNGRADVRVHRVGRIPLFGSRVVAIPTGFSTDPSVDSDLASGKAIEAYIEGGEPGLDVVDGTRLVIWTASLEGQVAEPRLAWEVSLNNRDPQVIGRGYIDAKTGRPLEYQSDIYTCSFGHVHARGTAETAAKGRDLDALLSRARAATAPVEHTAEAGMMDLSGTVLGWVNVTTSGTGAASLVPLPGISIQIPGVGTVQTDDNGDFSVPFGGTSPVSATITMTGRHVGSMSSEVGATFSEAVTLTPGTPAGIVLSSPGAGQIERSQLDIYWWTDRTNEYTRGILGPSPQLDTASDVDCFANIDDSCNAFYTSNTINFFTSGSGCNNTGFSTVIAHEWGHGLDDRFGVISQVDGLSEGWGDTLAIYLTGQPVVGAGFTGGGGFIRTALNNNTYPPGGFPAGGAPHPKGEVFMGFNWEVREGLIASLGAAAGVAQAELIVIGSVVADATNQPDALIEIFMLDDDNGNLVDGTVNYDVLSTAALNRNIPFPERQSVDLTAVPLPMTPDSPITAQLVSANAVLLSPGTLDVDVLFSTDGSPPSTRRSMVRVGATDDYIALLPGVESESVRYRFEATHSNGEVVQFPDGGGDFRYSFGEQIAFLDDFEGPGPNGWSSVQLAGPVQTGSNDWDLGVPQGSSGTSQGVGWADPSVAFSGSQVRGNDLGFAGFNGAYQANIVNELRSPNIDLTGLSNPRVRFARWLTVEEALFDQATLSINGTQLWQNPVSGNVIDTSWNVVEYPIPPAAISPAARFEFQLATDGGLQLGGWTIDDFQIVEDGPQITLPLEYRWVPEQVDAGGVTNAVFEGTPNAGLAIFVSASPGPIDVLGQTLEVGADAFVVTTLLDGSGQAVLPLQTNVSLAGALVFTQALQISAAGFEPSNPQVLLIN